jgi:beta-lactamase class A
MKRGSYTILRWVSIVLIFLAVLLVVYELVSYSRMRSTFPAGTTIGGVPVGGLDQQQTADRLTQAYSIPIEVHYNDAIIQIKPSNLGFQLKLETMVTAADVKRVEQPFWSAFWEFLWNRLPTSTDVPLSYTLSEQQLRTYLVNEIAARYDLPAEAARPVPGSASFQPGRTGQVLDIDRAVVQVQDALKSPNHRVVNLTIMNSAPPRTSFQNLGVLLKQIIDLSGFDGLSEVYVQDLSTGQDIHFAYDQGEDLPMNIAFTAASSIKIPVMISIFKRTSEPTPATISQELSQMIDRSDNTATDTLMQDVLDFYNGPLTVTDDMQKLGLKNTFIVGYFYNGAPRLRSQKTEANLRTDVNTNPDSYNQTTPEDIGMLLEDIYQCAQTGGGTLAVVFPGQISQTECQSMINYLLKNKIGVLLEAGLPDGTHIAHKHGWITEADGLMHSISDAGIIFTSGGDYVMTVYMYQPTQLLFDPVNQLVAQLSNAVYNYFNTPAQ